MAKKRMTSKQSHNRPLISGDEVLKLVSDAIAFSRVSGLAIEEIEKLDADHTRYHEPIHDGRGWPAGIVWESLQTVSHFNLAISLELTLKALIRLENPRDRRDTTHKLSILHDRLTPPTRNRLEAAWTMIDTSVPMELVAFVHSKSMPQSPQHCELNSLRDWFAYFDTDLQMYTKRYSWENLAKEKYRHYIKDLRLFHGLFDILRILALDKAKDIGILLPEKQNEKWRQSPNFLTKSSVDNLDSFYKKSGWHKDGNDRWMKRRLDGNHILVHRPDLFWRLLIMMGENYLTVEAGQAWGSARNLDDGKCTEPVLVAELKTSVEK